MTYDFSQFDRRTEEIIEWLSKEFSSIRTGSATPALLDGIQVESYGARVPMNQVGSVGVEDARTLRISTWDAGNVKAVEKAIQEADLGVSVAVDEKGLRVFFPELTVERRSQLLKIAKSKLEEARVSIRGARDEAMKIVDSKERDGELSEDGKFNAKEEMQKKITVINGKIDEIMFKKEKEINQ